MVTELVDAMGASLGQQIQPTFGYYRQPNGWITVSPITRLERISYIEQGWEHLAKYGAFDMTPYVANHPFEGLFMFGGAGEMQVEQIIATGLYMDPPLVPTCRQHITQFHRGHKVGCWRGAKPVVFLQLADVPKGVLGPFPCEFCPRKLPTQQARNQHQQVAHKEELGNLQTGRSLGTSLAEAMSTVPKAGILVSSDPEREALFARIAELQAEKAKTDERRAAMAKARAARKPRK